MSEDTYSSPWETRYASEGMLRIFSDRNKYGLWRRLWVALAEGQKDLGLVITRDQIDQMRAYVDQIDFEEALRQEERCKHDVMAHIHTYGKQCPKAKGIVHLGATSCYVTDNGDILQYREALNLLRDKLATIVAQLSFFAEKFAETPCIGLTHLQPAQMTTVGKRACLWLQDFITDLKDLLRVIAELRLLGVKGAVGTQDSFLTLFEGDEMKVSALETHISNQFHFPHVYTISGQTYPRKQDVAICHCLANIAISAHKFATDVRLLASREELYEAMAEAQVGSSAMPYKRNPILCERICSLARYGITLSHNSEMTAALQWVERSLDDSANRRLTMPELFMCTDAVLNLLLHVSKGLQINETTIKANVTKHLPLIVTEAILMQAVKRGGDRQVLHERLRMHSLKSGDVLEHIRLDDAFSIRSEEWAEYCNPSHFIGLAPQQISRFLVTEVNPLLALVPNRIDDTSVRM